MGGERGPVRLYCGFVVGGGEPPTSFHQRPQPGGAVAGVTAANCSATAMTSSCRPERDVCLDEIGSDAEWLAHRPNATVGGDAVLKQRHGHRRVGPTQGAECSRQRLVGREAGGLRPVGERFGALERDAGIFVKTTGCGLPGQHLHCDGSVGHVAQMVSKLGCLSGISEGSGVVAEPRSPGCEQCQAGTSTPTAPWFLTWLN